MYISLVLSSSVRSMRLRNQSQSQFNFILLFPVASVIVLVNAYLQPNEYAEMSSFGKAHAHLNVMKKPLGLFSKDPMTGFYRNGYCQVGPEDRGNHAIAATLTDPFLDFTASKGNNLRSIGLTAGCKWCLCANRWKEALDHFNSQDASNNPDVVPKVHLHATHEKALDVVSMDDLKKHAAEPEANNASNTAQSRKGGMGGAIKESTELAKKGEMISR